MRTAKPPSNKRVRSSVDVHDRLHTKPMSSTEPVSSTDPQTESDMHITGQFSTVRSWRQSH